MHKKVTISSENLVDKEKKTITQLQEKAAKPKRRKN